MLALPACGKTENRGAGRSAMIGVARGGTLPQPRDGNPHDAGDACRDRGYPQLARTRDILGCVARKTQCDGGVEPIVIAPLQCNERIT